MKKHVIINSNREIKNDNKDKINNRITLKRVKGS